MKPGDRVLYRGREVTVLHVRGGMDSRATNDDGERAKETDMEDIKPGDVVVLNSGGPRMTVTGIGESDVAVSWATRHQSKPEEHDGRVNHARFPRVTLTKVSS